MSNNSLGGLVRTPTTRKAFAKYMGCMFNNSLSGLVRTPTTRKGWVCQQIINILIPLLCEEAKRLRQSPV